MKISPTRYARLLYSATHAIKASERAPILKSFVRLLAQERALSSLPRILELYKQYYNRQEKVQDIQIISAHPLEITTLKSFQVSLGVPHAEYTVITREECLGGISVKIGDDITNTTLAYQLEQLSNKLSS